MGVVGAVATVVVPAVIGVACAATGIGLVATIALGAVTGAVIAGGTAAASTAQQDGKVDLETVGVCAGVGAVVGAVVSGISYGITKLVQGANAAKGAESTGDVAGNTSKATEGAGKAVQKAKYGQQFGKTGTYVENPKINVDWSKCTEHGAKRMAERGMSQEAINEIVKDGYALSQEGGKYLFLTEKGAAVVDSSGKLITTYGSELFDETIKAILKTLIGG